MFFISMTLFIIAARKLPTNNKAIKQLKKAVQIVYLQEQQITLAPRIPNIAISINVEEKLLVNLYDGRLCSGRISKSTNPPIL